MISHIIAMLETIFRELNESKVTFTAQIMKGVEVIGFAVYF